MILQYILLQEESMRHTLKRQEQSSRLEIASGYRKELSELFSSWGSGVGMSTTSSSPRAHKGSSNDCDRKEDAKEVIGSSRRKGLHCPLDKDPRQYVTQYVHRMAPESTLRSLLAEYQHRLSPVAPTSNEAEDATSGGDEECDASSEECVYNDWDPVSPPSDHIKGLLASLPEALSLHGTKRDDHHSGDDSNSKIRKRGDGNERSPPRGGAHKPTTYTTLVKRQVDRKDSTSSRRSLSSNPSVILSAVDDEKIFRDYLKRIEKRAHALVGIATIDASLHGGVSPRTNPPPGLTVPTAVLSPCQASLSVFSSMESNGKPSKGRHTTL